MVILWNGRRSDVFGGYLSSPSLQYGAVTLFWRSLEKTIFLSPDLTETAKYHNIYMSVCVTLYVKFVKSAKCVKCVECVKYFESVKCVNCCMGDRAS